MDLKSITAPLLKYWWLIVLAAIVSLLSSYFVTQQQPSVYQARATLIIGRAVYQPNPNSSDLYLGQQLAFYYADIAQREPVKDATMKSLGLSELPEFAVRPIPNTQLLEIAVTDVSPIRAQAVANELAKQLVKLSPTNSQQKEQDRQTFIDQQLNTMETEISDTQNQILQLSAKLSELVSAREIANTQQSIETLRLKLTTLQTNYVNLYSNTSGGAINTLTVIEPAILPTSPVGPRKAITILLTVVIAIVIASGAAYFLDYLDDTLKSPEDVTKLLNLPVLGNIIDLGKNSSMEVYVSKHPHSSIAEAFRSLRINLEFMGVNKPLKTYLITSTGMTEGKTSVAVNLAVIIAQAGKKVVLLDADLRKPNVQHFFELTNNRGISDIFRGSFELNDVVLTMNNEKILVVTSGTPPPNPADLLGSKKMDEILESLKRMADIVIIDGPPLLVADSAILSTKVDAVLMIIRHSFIRREAALAALDQLNRVGANVIGIVLNRLPRAGQASYVEYLQYYSEVDTDEHGKPTADSRKNKNWIADLAKRAKNILG